MTLLNAPRYDPAVDRRNRNLLIAGLVLVLLTAAIGVGGFFAGHGWFFDNLGIEHHVGKFLQAVEDNRLEDAYALWQNDPDWKQHPQNPNYDFKRFSEDWGPQSVDGAIRTYHVDISKRAGSGCIVAAKINNREKPMFLWYEMKTKKMSFSPLILQY